MNVDKVEVVDDGFYIEDYGW